MSRPLKARLIIHWSTGDEPIAVQFNPEQFQLEKGVQLAEISIPQLTAPLQQFIRGQAEKLTVELFFDTTDQGIGDAATSVTRYTDPIYALTRIEPAAHAPPTVTFEWGAEFPGNRLPDRARNQRRTSFKGVVESVRQQFTLFNGKGVPLRATLNLTIREYQTLDEQVKSLNKSSPDRTHVHVLQEGETLSRVAGSYYGRPDLWRTIAEENGLDDPRRQPAGLRLRIPPLPGRGAA